MKYNNIGFNAAWAASVTEEAFIAHEKHHGLTTEQLREAYQLNKKEGSLIKKIEKVEAQAATAQVSDAAVADTAQTVEALKTQLADGNDSPKTPDSASLSAAKSSGKSTNPNKGKGSGS